MTKHCVFSAADTDCDTDEFRHHRPRRRLDGSHVQCYRYGPGSDDFVHWDLRDSSSSSLPKDGTSGCCSVFDWATETMCLSLAIDLRRKFQKRRTVPDM